MLNRASTLLQQLEDDDAAVAAAAAAATSSSSPSDSSSASGSGDLDSPENEVNALLSNEGAMEIDDDAGSIERMINQVVNVSSAAALLTAFRQSSGQGGAQAPNPPSSAPPPPPNQQSTSITASTAAAPPVSATDPSTISVPPTTGASATIQPSNNNSTQNQPATPSRRPESPRIRELGTALQDYLALQDRLTPFLRFLQDALRQNRLYTEDGEALSTQYVYDTVSSVLHLLGHSLHAFSEIMCDFNLPPDDRRLTASSSILVEQSTVVRATIPMAFNPQAMLAQAAAAGAGAGAAAAATAAAATGANNGAAHVPLPPTSSAGGTNPNPFTPTPFSTGITGIPGLSISVSAAPGVPGMQSFGGMTGIPINIPGLPTGIAGIIPTQMNSQWTNPNAPSPANNSTSSTNPPGQGQQPPPPTAPAPAAQNGQDGSPRQPAMQLPGGAMLPPGLQNLGALLGAGGAGGLANLFGGAAGGMQMQPGMQMQNPFMNLQQFQMGMGNNNNNNSVRNQQQPVGSNASSTASSGQQGAATASRPTANGGSGATGQGNTGGGGNNSLQNLLRNELSRPQFDPLLPCHTYHSHGRGGGRSSSNNISTRARPAEFRRFVNVDDAASMEAAQNRGSAEGETVEILIDLLRNSRIIDLLQPVLKDVVLNYLMRGRDPKNPAHVKTCAKGLVKKLLPFLEQFSVRRITIMIGLDLC